MSASSNAYDEWYDREGARMEISAIESYVENAVENITAAHGAEIANEVEEHITFSVDLSDYMSEDNEGYPVITEDVYMLPGVSKLIESMSDYAA